MYDFRQTLSLLPSQEPAILLFLSIFLVLAWKTAGWWGLDRWVLVDLGTPWSPGLTFQEKPA